MFFCILKFSLLLELCYGHLVGFQKQSLILCCDDLLEPEVVFLEDVDLILKPGDFGTNCIFKVLEVVKLRHLFHSGFQNAELGNVRLLHQFLADLSLISLIIPILDIFLALLLYHIGECLCEFFIFEIKPCIVYEFKLDLLVLLLYGGLQVDNFSKLRVHLHVCLDDFTGGFIKHSIEVTFGRQIISVVFKHLKLIIDAHRLLLCFELRLVFVLHRLYQFSELAHELPVHGVGVVLILPILLVGQPGLPFELVAIVPYFHDVFGKSVEQPVSRVELLGVVDGLQLMKLFGVAFRLVRELIQLFLVIAKFCLCIAAQVCKFLLHLKIQPFLQVEMLPKLLHFFVNLQLELGVIIFRSRNLLN